MVLHRGIGAIAWIAAVLLTTISFQDISEREAVDRASQFVRVACEGIGSTPTEAPDWSTSRAVEVRSVAGRETAYLITFQSGLARLTKSGRIPSASLPPQPNAPRSWQASKVIPAAASLAVCQKYFKAAGFDALLRLESVARSIGTPYEDRCLEVRVKPSYRGVNYGYGFDPIFLIEHTNGRLEQMSIGFDRLPTPPSSLSPGISIESATGAITTYLKNHEGVNRAYFVRSTELNIWLPTRLNGLDGLSYEDQQKQSAGQGMLVYYGVVFDLDKTSSDLQNTSGSYGVFVDARDGRVITVWAHRGGLGGGGKATTRFTWDLDEPRLEARIANSKLYRGPARVSFVKMVDQPPFEGKHVELTCGRIVYSALYDSRSGLLCVPTQGRYSLGRPDQKLAAALMKLR